MDTIFPLKICLLPPYQQLPYLFASLTENGNIYVVLHIHTHMFCYNWQTTEMVYVYIIYF